MPLTVSDVASRSPRLFDTVRGPLEKRANMGRLLGGLAGKAAGGIGSLATHAGKATPRFVSPGLGVGLLEDAREGLFEGSFLPDKSLLGAVASRFMPGTAKSVARAYAPLTGIDLGFQGVTGKDPHTRLWGGAVPGRIRNAFSGTPLAGTAASVAGGLNKLKTNPLVRRNAIAGGLSAGGAGAGLNAMGMNPLRINWFSRETPAAVVGGRNLGDMQSWTGDPFGSASQWFGSLPPDGQAAVIAALTTGGAGILGGLSGQNGMASVGLPLAALLAAYGAGRMPGGYLDGVYDKQPTSFGA